MSPRYGTSVPCCPRHLRSKGCRLIIFERHLLKELPINRTFFGELQRSVGASASIVDHYVDLPESSDGLLRRYLHLLDIRYIQLENLDVVICAQLAFLFRRPHGSRDVPASLCEMERRQFAQAATGAGNEYRFGHVMSFLWA